MRKSLVVVALLLLGCDKSPAGKPDVGEFFSAEAFEGSVSASDLDVVCEGASVAESANINHPKIVRGSVVASPPESASWSFFSEAFAVPIEGEVLRAGVTVTLGTKDKIWRETRTDPLGRFCFRLPFNGYFDSDVFLTADVDGIPLRRIVADRQIAIVSSQSEAVALIADSYHPLSRGEALNLQTMADTRSDLGRGVMAERDIAATVARVKRDLENDPRIKAWVTRRMTSN